MVEADVEPIIGIDLGTTNSCVGVWDSNENRVVIIANDQGNTTTPSFVAFNPNGEAVVGERARTFDNWVNDAKRYIGRKFGDAEVQRLRQSARFNVVEGKRGRCEVDLGSSGKYTMEEVSAKVLNSMKKLAEAHVGREVKKAVVTVPAYFNLL